MIRIEVLYTDETRRKEFAKNAGTLPKTDVLMVFVHTAVQTYRYLNDEWYVFGYKAPSQWFVHGWDNYDDRVRVYDEKESNPGVYTEVSIPRRAYPPGYEQTIFEGGYVDPVVWERVEKTAEGIMLGRNKARGDR